MDLSWAFSLFPYGNYWRDHRRLFHSEFNIRGVSWHHPQQTHGAHGFLQRLLAQPNQWQDILRQ